MTRQTKIQTHLKTPTHRNRTSRFDIYAGSSALADMSSVVCAWLFGSSKDGIVEAGSDIDVGVLFAAKPDLAEMLRVVDTLEAAFGAGEIDLVVLNDASPVLRFEAISGRRIFCRDRERFADFFSLTSREYEEAMIYLARGLRYRREAMAHWQAKP